MTYEDHDKAKELIEKIESGKITRDEIIAALELLLRDLWDRGLD